jgi:2-oxoglutarate ferredoxin oxidoreductase subunit beta
MLTQQIQHAKDKKAADLDKLLRGNEVWNIA